MRRRRWRTLHPELGGSRRGRPGAPLRRSRGRGASATAFSPSALHTLATRAGPVAPRECDRRLSLGGYRRWVAVVRPAAARGRCGGFAGERFALSWVARGAAGPARRFAVRAEGAHRQRLSLLA